MGDDDDGDIPGDAGPDDDSGLENQERPDGDNVYSIGYGKPPRHTRFKPGKSGNPRGRKKGSRGLKTDLDVELKRPVEVTVGKYRFKGTTQQLALRTLALLSANGNLKAISQFVPLILSVFGTEDRGADKRGLSPHDEAIIENFQTAFGDDVSDWGAGTVADAPQAEAGGGGGEGNQPPPPAAASADEPGDDPEGGGQ